MNRLLAAVVAAASLSALALAPATNRAVNNLRGAVANVQLIPELRNGPIGKDKEQTAKNLLRDLDQVLTRGDRELSGIPEADKADPAVAEVTAKLTELRAFRDDLKKALEGGAATSAANEATYRQFKEETKKYERAVSIFRQGAHGGGTAEAMAELAELDQLCRTKYAGLVDDDKLAFKLNISPVAWCKIAADRQATKDTAVKEAVADSLQSVVARVEEDRAKLAQRQGLLDVDGISYKLLMNREQGKAALAAKLGPAMKSVGQEIGPDTFKELDAKVDAFGAEIDRLAPTWKFEGTSHDAATEAGAKAAFAKDYPGRAVLKTGLLFAQASIDKNALGVPTERYRTGALLSKGSGKWCEYRQFTAHETYSGGGGYAAPRFTFGAMRLQKCE